MTDADKLARVRRMRALRIKRRWTLQQIADVYHISRERVRQLIGNTGGWRYPKR